MRARCSFWPAMLAPAATQKARWTFSIARRWPKGRPRGRCFSNYKFSKKPKICNKRKRCFRSSIELYPKEISFKKELIRLYLFQHRNDDAEKEQRAIVAADPTNVKAQLDLVRLLNTTKGAAAAQQELLTALIKGGGTSSPTRSHWRNWISLKANFRKRQLCLKRSSAMQSSAEHVLDCTDQSRRDVPQSEADR